jgi:hypothetical protein
LTLDVTGDSRKGYSVALLFNGKPILRHNQGGEFSAVFQNDERNLEERVDDWKATAWTGDDIADAIGFAEIFPEYLSLWLFKRKILIDEIVVNHLNRIPVMMATEDARALTLAARCGRS